MFKLDQTKLQSIKAEIERQWRNEELAKADIEVNKALDSNLPTLPNWKAYRQALRDWPDSSDFPDPTKRPTPPE